MIEEHEELILEVLLKIEQSQVLGVSPTDAAFCVLAFSRI